jgi:hypothetical protein
MVIDDITKPIVLFGEFCVHYSYYMGAWSYNYFKFNNVEGARNKMNGFRHVSN